jgi:hypothetical protein
MAAAVAKVKRRKTIQDMEYIDVEWINVTEGENL